MVFFWAFSNGKKYDEYLSQKETIEGRWIGEAATVFGVTPNSLVRSQEWNALCDNRHPLTGQKITKRKNTFRHEKGFYKGELVDRIVSNRTPIYDATISAPKSFSILLMVGQRKDVLDWHEKAVDKVVLEIERLTSRWDKKGGQKRLEVTGKFCASRFSHFTNRSLEPMLHTHLTIQNATPGSDGNNYALEPSAWISRCSYLTQIYRDALAAEAIKAGLEIKLDEFGAPQVANLLDMIPLYSQRSMDIQEMVECAEGIAGSKLTDGERKRLVIACRGIDLVLFRATWLQERDKLTVQYINAPDAQKASKQLLSAFESLIRHCSDTEPPAPSRESLLEGWQKLIDPEQSDRLLKLAQDQSSSPPRAVGVREAVEWSIRHNFERLSVVKSWMLERDALRYAVGSNLDLVKLKQCIEGHEALIHRGEEVTTRDHYKNECDVSDWLKLGENKGVRLARIESEALTKHQLEAVNELLGSSEQFVTLIGKSGSGKSETLSALIKANTDQGYRVASMAPSTRSTDVIKHQDKSTLQLFLIDKKLQMQLRPNDLIALDEAGFASFAQIHALMEIAVKQRLRIIFCGDPRQHVSVEAGDGFRIMLERTHVKREWLSEILRQGQDAMDGRYRRAAKLFSVGKTTDAFATLDRAGAIHIAQGDERVNLMAEAYMDRIKSGKSVICVQPSHRENDLLNEAIRKRLKDEGLISAKEENISVHRSVGLTLAERQDVRNLKIGWVIEMTIGPSKGKVYEIRQIDQAKNVAYGFGDGVRIGFDKSNAEAWQACERRKIWVARGDRMVTNSGMKSRKNGDTMNGYRFTVAGFDKNRSIITTDGKVIETRNIAHAYASTSHKSQGETVDHVLFGCDRKSVNWICQKLAYVGCTRGRERVDIYAESKNDLVQIESKPGNRKSAIELVDFVLRHVLDIYNRNSKKIAHAVEPWNNAAHANHLL